MDLLTIDGGADIGPAGRAPRTVLEDQPEHGAASVTIGGRSAQLSYRDWTRNVFTIVWPNGYQERVTFLGRKACPKCLRHHPPACGPIHDPEGTDAP